MAKNSMELLELLRKVTADSDVDTLREAVRIMAQAIMEEEVADLVGAGRGERSETRKGHRNGYRDRGWDTRVGSIELKVPRVRDGGYIPSLLEPRRRGERALLCVIQEAYVHGVSTRKVDDLVRALGMTGISKSSVSRICAELDTQVEAFRCRPLLGHYPYLMLDATYVKVREAGHVTSMATVIAMAVTETGEREIVGIDVGPSEDGAFWTEFLRSLVARGLAGVRLVVSDSHSGLKEAIFSVFSGATWQRCRVHFMRNALSQVPKAASPMAAAAIRTIFAQPDAENAHEQLGRVVASLRARFPKVSEMLQDAEEDILAHMAFPEAHRRRMASTNPLERINKEIKRRTNVVGIFPNRASLIRLAGAILSEQNDEWQVCRRYFSAESMAALRTPIDEEVAPQTLVALN